MPKDRRTLLKEWLDRVDGWDAWTEQRDVLLSSGFDTEKAHWRAAKDIGYPGGVPSVTEAPAAPAKVLAVEKSFGGGGIRSDFDWVYRNVSVMSVTPDEAPSSGAWGLLQFARSDPRSFFTKWMDIASRQDDREQLMADFREDATRRTDEIAEMLRSFREAKDDEPGSDLASSVDVEVVAGSETSERSDDDGDPGVVVGGGGQVIGEGVIDS